MLQWESSIFAATTPIGRVLRLPLRLIPPGSVVRVLAGPGRGDRWIAGAGPHSCWLGFNELRKRRLFAAAVGRGSVVYDIGANVGSYTLLASKLVGSNGRVLAFEPVPQNLAYLRRHLEINESANVDVLEAAVVERSGPVRFNALTDRLMGFVGSEGTLQVEGLALDDVVARGGRAPTCLKIDVEGGEAAVLHGAQHLFASSRPFVFVATHGSEARLDCLAFFRDAHYAVRAVRGSPDELVAAPSELALHWMRSGDFVSVA